MWDESDASLDVLFIGEHSTWPLDQGFCIRGTNLARALRRQGVRVGLSSIAPLPSDAPADLHDMQVPWPTATLAEQARFLHAWRGPGAWLRRRLADYQGRDLPRFAGVLPLIEQTRPRVVVGLGQHSLLLLRALAEAPGLTRIWYAADELMWFQLSCLRREGLSAVPLRLQKLALYGGLELAFARGLEGAIGVNPRDTRLLHTLAGARQTTTIRNGVDLDYFHPQPQADVQPESLVFWGRMDFEPNIDAVCWFAREVWPTLHARHPQARWRIVGKAPHDSVMALRQLPGVEVTGPVDDLRPLAWGSTCAILPMHCGGGIKNKLLEGAGLGLAMVASPLAVQGLELPDTPAVLQVCATPAQWISEIETLWRNADVRMELGAQAYAWVRQQHSWDHAAQQFVDFAAALGADLARSAEHLDELELVSQQEAA